jgi:hypothetical protein
MDAKMNDKRITRAASGPGTYYDRNLKWDLAVVVGREKKRLS